MITDTYAALLIGIMAAVTLVIRVLPFLIFSRGQTPEYILYLGKVLPFAIIGMLVVYCLKDVQITSATHGLPEFIAVAVTAGLHVWRRSTLFSILAGTILYMLLIQFVFV